MESDRRSSSRLIKQERKKLTRQILWFSAIAVALVLLFIFVVLPLFIKFVNSVLNTNPIAEDDSIILQPPVLSAPIEATNSAQFKISGIADPQEEVVIVLNGQEFGRTPTQEDGSFSADIQLTEGENSFTTYAVDSAKHESKTGQDYTVSLDTEKPTLEVTEPEDGKEFSKKDRNISIVGKTDPLAKIYINDRVVFPDATGGFRTQFSLADGDNELKIKSVDVAGNSIEMSRKVKLNN